MNTESRGYDCCVVTNLVWRLVNQLCGEESEWLHGGVGTGEWGGCEEDNWYVQLSQSVQRAEVCFCNPCNTDIHFHVDKPYLAC